MNYLIFAWSIALIYIVLLTTKRADSAEVPNRFKRLLHFIRVAPILAFAVLIILVFSYFHTKAGIRLSHAWYVAQFWAYTAFLYCSLVISKNKITIIPMLITLAIAIYNTPLFHYEKLFTGRYVIVSDIFGVLMFLMMWVTTTKALRKEVSNAGEIGV